MLPTGCVILAAVASYVLPAGEPDRRRDEATGRMVVVAGTYHEVDRSPGAAAVVVGVAVGPT